MGAISDDINTAFEVAFNMLQTNVPIVASMACGGVWFIYGYIYNDRTYGFLYGIRFDGITHMIKCYDGVISHT